MYYSTSSGRLEGKVGLSKQWLLHVHMQLQHTQRLTGMARSA